MSVEIPGYVAGTWAIDPVHSEVSFVVRHMMVSKVRGRFDKFEGTFVTGADPLQSSVTAKVDLNSINTGQEQRDAHIAEIQAAQAAYDAKSGPPPCPDTELSGVDAAS